MAQYQNLEDIGKILGAFGRETDHTQKDGESMPGGFPRAILSIQIQDLYLSLFCVARMRHLELGNLFTKEIYLSHLAGS